MSTGMEVSISRDGASVCIRCSIHERQHRPRSAAGPAVHQCRQATQSARDENVVEFCKIRVCVTVVMPMIVEIDNVGIDIVEINNVEFVIVEIDNVGIDIVEVDIVAVGDRHRESKQRKSLQTPAYCQCANLMISQPSLIFRDKTLAGDVSRHCAFPA